MKYLPLFAALLLSSSRAFGQTEHDAEIRAAIGRLSYLEGEWRGEGTMILGPGRVATARVTEKATFRLDKTLFMLEGSGSATFPDGSTRNVHDALGLISFDAESQRYVFRTYRAGGEILDPSIQVEDDGIVWSFKQGERTIRFTARVEDSVWAEKGEASVDDGKTWYPFFEMKLHREVGDSQ